MVIEESSYANLIVYDTDRELSIEKRLIKYRLACRFFNEELSRCHIERMIKKLHMERPYVLKAYFLWDLIMTKKMHVQFCISVLVDENELQSRPIKSRITSSITIGKERGDENAPVMNIDDSILTNGENNAIIEREFAQVLKNHPADYATVLKKIMARVNPTKNGSPTNSIQIVDWINMIVSGMEKEKVKLHTRELLIPHGLDLDHLEGEHLYYRYSPSIVAEITKDDIINNKHNDVHFHDVFYDDEEASQGRQAINDRLAEIDDYIFKKTGIVIDNNSGFLDTDPLIDAKVVEKEQTTKPEAHEEPLWSEIIQLAMKNGDFFYVLYVLKKHGL